MMFSRFLIFFLYPVTYSSRFCSSHLLFRDPLAPPSADVLCACPLNLVGKPEKSTVQKSRILPYADALNSPPSHCRDRNLFFMELLFQNGGGAVLALMHCCLQQKTALASLYSVVQIYLVKGCVSIALSMQHLTTFIWKAEYIDGGCIGRYLRTRLTCALCTQSDNRIV